MAGGRPTLYEAAHCETVVELGGQGKSHAQIAAALGVSRQSLYEWASVHPEFSVAITHARDLALAWWEDQAQTNLATSGFNASLWSRSMAARFPADYTERKQTELTGANGGPVETVTKIEVVAVEPGER